MKNIKELTLSAVIACYKDGEAIPIMHKKLTKVFNKIGCNYEIIFVNDGSPDNSEEILEEICSIDKNTIAIFHSRNFKSNFNIPPPWVETDYQVLFQSFLC